MAHTVVCRNTDTNSAVVSKKIQLTEDAVSETNLTVFSFSRMEFQSG